MSYTVDEARVWLDRAERAARHLKRRPDTTWRAFLESTIRAARGVTLSVALPLGPQAPQRDRPIPPPPPNVERPA